MMHIFIEAIIYLNPSAAGRVWIMRLEEYWHVRYEKYLNASVVCFIMCSAISE